MFIKHHSSAGFVHTDIYTLERFENEKGNISLLLDPQNHEIWIRKMRLDSKAIPSSSATIQILKTLLDNLGKEIKNSKLPKSSYSQDRNELQSKIISPLNKQLKKTLNKELPVHIHGSIDEFTIILKGLPLSIHVIEKAL